MRTNGLVNAMTMMILDEVEIESGHWFVPLVNKSRKHNETTERAGSGNGAEAWKLVKDISKKNLLPNTVVAKVKGRKNLLKGFLHSVKGPF